jgi:hypothetical protein
MKRGPVRHTCFTVKNTSFAAVPETKGLIKDMTRYHPIKN